MGCSNPEHVHDIYNCSITKPLNLYTNAISCLISPSNAIFFGNDLCFSRRFNPSSVTNDGLLRSSLKKSWLLVVFPPSRDALIVHKTNNYIVIEYISTYVYIYNITLIKPSDFSGHCINQPLTLTWLLVVKHGQRWHRWRRIGIELCYAWVTASNDPSGRVWHGPIFI